MLSRINLLDKNTVNDRGYDVAARATLFRSLESYSVILYGKRLYFFWKVWQRIRIFSPLGLANVLCAFVSISWRVIHRHFGLLYGGYIGRVNIIINHVRLVVQRIVPKNDLRNRKKQLHVSFYVKREE